MGWFLSTPGLVGFQAQLLRLFCLDPHNSARNTHGHPVKSLLFVRGHKEKKPLWVDPRRAKKQTTTCVSLDAANDESYNISKTPRMQNPRPSGPTNTTREVHNAYSHPHKSPADSGKGRGTVISLLPFQGCLYTDEQNLGQDFSCDS